MSDFSPSKAPTPIDQQLLNLAEQYSEVFRTRDNEPYVRFLRTVGNVEHFECHPVRSAAFRNYLGFLWYGVNQRGVNARVVQIVIDAFVARALYDPASRVEPVHLRVAKHDGDIYIDLADEHWRAVRITKSGVQVVSSKECPVRFRRSEGMLALPEPDLRGTVDDVAPFIFRLTNDEKILFLAFLAYVAGPSNVYGILLLEGEEGSGKTTIAILTRNSVDPIDSKPGGMPRNEDDFMIGATKNHLIHLENLSEPIRPWASDLLCRIVGGAGHRKRSLYTDQDEVRLNATRPVVITSIPRVVWKPDALDRSIRFVLPEWEGERKSTKQIEVELSTARPRITGLLYRALSAVLANIDRVKPLPPEIRMVDFARVAIAAGPVLGYTRRQFLDAYLTNIRATKRTTIQDAAFGPALLKVLDGHTDWKGTAETLLASMCNVATDEERHSPEWPKTPAALSALLARYRRSLEGSGWKVVRGRSNANRSIGITAVTGSTGDDGDARDAQ